MEQTEERSSELSERVADISKTAQEIQKIGWVNSLLGPSAKVLGDHWAERIKSKLNEKEEARIRDRVAAVQAELAELELPEANPSTIGALIEWTQSVKDIDGSSGIVSGAWERALVEIVKGDRSLLKFLQSANEKDIQLISLGGFSSPEEVSRLREYGLIRENEVTSSSKAQVVRSSLFFLVLFLYSTIGLIEFKSFLARGIALLWVTSVLVFFLLIQIPLILAHIRSPKNEMYRYLRTEKGLYIAKLIRPEFDPAYEEVGILTSSRERDKL